MNNIYRGPYTLLSPKEKESVRKQLSFSNKIGEDECCNPLERQLIDKRAYLEVAYDSSIDKLLACCGYKPDFHFSGNRIYMEKGYSFRDPSFDKQVFYQMNYKILDKLKVMGYGLNKVISKIRPTNIASIKFTNKGGFTFIETIYPWEPLNIYLWTKEPNYK